jgi:hypothetical protein
VLLAMVGVAVAAPWEKFIVGDLEVQYNGGFTPKVISKKKPTPIAFNVAAKIASLNPDDRHPPALREFLIEGDKHGSIDVKGIPTCTGGRLQSRTSKAAREACGPALIGSGKTDVEIQFPEQPPIDVHSELLAFNGGLKIHKGRYGLESIATVPKIAGGSGSVTFFTLTLNKGIISATCPDGHLNARGTAVFADGTKAKGTVVRPCTGKG